MKRATSFIAGAIALLSTSAHANLCDSVKDTTTTAETKRDVGFYEELFSPTVDARGNQRWNEIVVQCNRQRDTKGNEIAMATQSSGANADKTLLKSAHLDSKIIRGHYNFFGTIVSQLKYVYVLSKTNGIWTMVIPYKAVFNELVADRVDFYVGSRKIDPASKALGAVRGDDHAWQLYDASQVIAKADSKSGRETFLLKPSALPIAKTLCSTSTYFPGDSGKYDGESDANAYRRDPENKFISLGKIQYRYNDYDSVLEGCRVAKSRDLFWVEPEHGEVLKVKPQDWILDNFVRAAESYWTIPGKFELKLLLIGRNEAQFAKSTLNALRDDDYLTVRFATKFLPYQFNQMYKSNIIQFNNFSTMTTDGSYRHEVGHAFGLDDEYGGEKKDGTIEKQNSCENADYAGFSPATYQMCKGGVDYVHSIYHYIAASRYVTKQSECNQDSDCASGEYCNAGLDLSKNQCVAKKADNEGCDLVNGARQCQSGNCNLGRCYTPKSVVAGGTCYCDDACKEGKCSAIDGTKGSCVCKEDSDCSPGSYCDAGVDLKTNRCRVKLAVGESCGKVGSVGNDHKCKSGECSGFPKYECK